jgi:hypothetical protein
MILTILGNPVYRRRISHRLMLGTAISISALAIPQLWGTAAVPEGTLNVFGARGTEATCSALGFLHQFFGFSVPSYYAALSILAFLAGKNDYHLEKYAHVEKWIHIGVHLFPLLSAIYLLHVEAFNYSGHTCWIASKPLGCGDGSDVVCTRGPQNIRLYQWIFSAMPGMLLLLIPTLLMLAFYMDVRRRQHEIRIEVKVVVWQSSLYLLALYWTYSFSFINGVLIFAAKEHFFSMTLISSMVECLLGFWVLLAYLLRLRGPSSTQISSENEGGSCKVKPRVVRDQSATTISHSATSLSTARLDDVDVERTLQTVGPNRSDDAFSIFDGTKSSSKWSDFVFDGDSSDEEEDDFESSKWEGVLQP